MKITMKHMYIPPSGLLGTHWTWTHDLAVILTQNPRPKTWDLKTKIKTNMTQFHCGMTWSSKAKKGTKTSPPFSFMACLAGCKTDTNETPTYAYAKSYWSLMEGSRPTLIESRSGTAGAFSWSQEGIWSKLAAYETIIQGKRWIKG